MTLTTRFRPRFWCSSEKHDQFTYATHWARGSTAWRTELPCEPEPPPRDIGQRMRSRLKRPVRLKTILYKFDLSAAADRGAQLVARKVDRDPIVLCHLEGKTHEEAARLLHWPVGTLSGRLSRGRRLFKWRRLERRGLTVSSARCLLAVSAGRIPSRSTGRALLDLRGNCSPRCRWRSCSHVAAFGPFLDPRSLARDVPPQAEIDRTGRRCHRRRTGECWRLGALAVGIVAKTRGRRARDNRSVRQSRASRTRNLVRDRWANPQSARSRHWPTAAVTIARSSEKTAPQRTVP